MAAKSKERVYETAAAAPAGNRTLSSAKKAKQDEFYTQYVDIQKEVEAYLEYDPDTFRGKIVYCNCDDPVESNFFKYFAEKFDTLGLKELITTSYAGSPIAGTEGQLSLYDVPEEQGAKPPATALRIREKLDLPTDRDARVAKINQYLAKNPDASARLEGRGDFRRAECVALLKQADIVVTNPPFSLFREYVDQLIKHEKKFLIIGNVQAITYKEVFPLIKGNKLWMGVTIHSGDREFRVPDHYPLQAAGWRVDESGAKYIRVKGVRWWTNLDHGPRHRVLQLQTMADNLRYSKHKELRGKSAYDRYDNYDAIEVPYTDAIPSDYDGAMGVPITFLDKYNPDQFEILAITQAWDGNASKIYPKQIQVGKDGKRSDVSKLNDGAAISVEKPPNDQTYYIVGTELFVKTYCRIIIRHRKAASKINS